jgi:long-chain acyl-CoA synthetase
MLLDTLRDRPDEIALDDTTRRRTWRELLERSARTARILADAGVGPGGHAAVLMDNRVEYVEILLGAVMAGAWLTPINRHLQADEIAYILEDSGAKLVFVDDDHAAHARSAGVPLLRAGEELESAIAAVAPAAGCDELSGATLDAPAGAAMIYTSGTSGRPKGVKRARRGGVGTTTGASVGETLAGFVDAGRALGLDGSGPHLVTGPLYHAAPLMFAVYDLAAGAPMTIMPRWSERAFLDLAAEGRVRHTHLVPTMFVRLLSLRDAEPELARPATLDLVLHGAAPIAPEVKHRMIDWWGPILREYWGATEGGYCTLVDSDDWLDHPGTVGRAVGAWEVFAVGEQGDRLPAGEEGLLYAHHGALERPFEYHRDAEKTQAAYIGPGTFTTGDVGRVDDEGWVYLTDRESNMIISGGVNIYPAEIEQALHTHPAVADVAVFGVPDAEWGEAVKAAVELGAGCEPSAELATELLAHARERLAGYKVPRSIDFERELPRHPTGKLYTRLLRDRYWTGREKKI